MKAASWKLMPNHSTVKLFRNHISWRMRKILVNFQHLNFQRSVPMTIKWLAFYVKLSLKILKVNSGPIRGLKNCVGWKTGLFRRARSLCWSLQFNFFQQQDWLWTLFGNRRCWSAIQILQMHNEYGWDNFCCISWRCMCPCYHFRSNRFIFLRQVSEKKRGQGPWERRNISKASKDAHRKPALQELPVKTG